MLESIVSNVQRESVWIQLFALGLLRLLIIAPFKARL